MDPSFDVHSVSYGFKKVNLEDDEDSVDGLDEEQLAAASGKSCRQHRKRRFWGVVYAGALGALAFLILLAVGFALGVPQQETRTRKETVRLSAAASSLTPLYAEHGCGGTEASARALGCRFDILSHSWTPVECWDQPLYDDMMRRYNDSLTFARAGKGEVVINARPESQAMGHIGHDGLGHENQTLITSWRTHLIACTYAWQKVTRAVLMQAPLDSWSASYSLAKSCGEQLVYRNQFGWDDMVVVKQVGFVECGLDATGMLKMLAAP